MQLSLNEYHPYNRKWVRALCLERRQRQLVSVSTSIRQSHQGVGGTEGTIAAYTWNKDVSAGLREDDNRTYAKIIS